MAKYVCGVCGYIHDEETLGMSFSSIEACPMCTNPPIVFEPVEEDSGIVSKSESTAAPNEINNLSYDTAFFRFDKSSRYMDEIHDMAVNQKSLIKAMGTGFSMPNWDDILILGSQLNPPPLDEDHSVVIETIIGRNAKKPLVISGPAYVSHMSFGALSREAKEALAKGSAGVNTAMCSGEGGILDVERESSYKYIFEYVPNLYSVTDENLRASDAIEIKIGQGSKPGMGGHLPGDKVTDEIAKIRNKTLGEDIISPSKFDFLNSKEDLKSLVCQLRETSEGRPIGIKIAAGRIEADLEYCVYAKPDFITIDGRGGATAASPQIIRDSTSIPTVFALHRAKKYLDHIGSTIELNITGGLRVSSDIAKALAMGANAVALATAPMIALACQQYRVCGSGTCPMGIATQNEELRKRLNIEVASKRVENFFKITFEELKTFARITCHEDIHQLSISDIVTTSSEISNNTDIAHV